MEGAGAPPTVHVLAIDDEKPILEIMRTALEDDECVVHAFTQPQEGIEFYRRHWQSLAVVLMDFMMPDLRGDQVYEQLKRINPAAKICLVSGCNAEEVEELRRRGLLCFIKKPFPVDELIGCVKLARCPRAGGH